MRSLERIKAHLKAAHAYAELSTARRLKVGAVIVREDRIVSIGYNGTPSGRDNNCEVLINPEGIVYTLKKKSEEQIQQSLKGRFELMSKPEVCHAEMNAIAFAARHGVSTNDCALIVTHSPCYECSKLIVQCGIKTVYYEIEYRDQTAVKFLKECNVNVKKIEE